MKTGSETTKPRKRDLPKYCYARGHKIWVRLKRENGKWKASPTPFTLDQVDEARRYVNAALRRIEVKAETSDLDDLTIIVYGERWLTDRENRGLSSAEDDARRLRRYVFPHIGEFSLEDLKPKHVRDLVRKLIALKKEIKDENGQKIGEERKLGARTIHHIYNTLHNLYESAVIDELVVGNPVKVEPHELPKKVDKDPEWRGLATYMTSEIEQLISEPTIPVQRRVMYALKALAGLRHGEAASVCVRHVDRSLEPLAKLKVVQAYDSRNNVVKSTKTEETRDVPIHPTLNKILTAWLEEHWPRVYGRHPTPDDFIVPTRTFNCINAKDAGEAMKRDLDVLGLRVKAGKKRSRGGHDLRSWFETRCIEDEADSMLIRRVTHAAPKTVSGGYERFSWATICREVVKLNVGILGGEPLRVITEQLQAEVKAAGRWQNMVTPKGLEPLNYAHLRAPSDSNSYSKNPLGDSSRAGSVITSITRYKRMLTELEHAVQSADMPRAQLVINRMRNRQNMAQMVEQLTEK